MGYIAIRNYFGECQYLDIISQFNGSRGGTGFSIEEPGYFTTIDEERSF